MKLVKFIFLMGLLHVAHSSLYAMNEKANNTLWDKVFFFKKALKALQEGADANYTRNGIPVIVRVAAFSKLKQIKLLLAYGADINSASTAENKIGRLRYPIGTTPLYAATRETFDPELSEELLMNGAHINIGPELTGAAFIMLDARIKGKEIAERQDEAMRWFLEHGLRLTEADLQQLPIVNQVKKIYNKQLLLQAIVFRGNVGDLIAAMKKDSEQGALSEDIINELNQAFVLGAAQESPALVDIFEAPQLLNLILPQTFRAAMERAALIGDLSMVKRIVQHAQKHGHIEEERSQWAEALRKAYLYAHGQGHQQVVAFLKEYNEILHLDVDFSQQHEESRQPSDILPDNSKEKEKEKEKEEDSQQPPKQVKRKELGAELIQAIKYQKNDLVKQLLEAGVDPNVDGADGCSALIIAGLYGNFDALKLLVEHGANLDALIPDTLDIEDLPVAYIGRSSSFMIGGNIIWAVVDYLRRFSTVNISPILTWLETHGADLNQLNNKGQSVITLVAPANGELLRWLFEAGVGIPEANFVGKDERETVIQQVDNAYPRDHDPVAHMILLYRAGVYGNEQETFELIKDKINRHALHKGTRGKWLIMAIAQRMSYKQLEFIKFTTMTAYPKDLQRALIVAVRLGNHGAASALIEYNQAAIDSDEANWHEAVIKALNLAVKYGRANIISLLLNALSLSVIGSVIADIRKAIEDSPEIKEEDRRSLLKQIENALAQSSKETGHLSRTGSAALSRLIVGLPSGLIAGILTVLSGIWQHSSNQ